MQQTNTPITAASTTPDKAVSTRGMGKTFGKSGTQNFNGIISSEEYNARLTGHQALRQYDIMRRSDSTVRAALQMCKLPLLALDRNIEPASDDEFDVYVADFIKAELFDRNVKLHDLLRESLSCFDFGYSVAEKTLQLTEFQGQPRIGIANIGFRKQTSIYSWETPDGKPGITQQLIGEDNAGIPMVKLMVFTHEREGDNYEGISLLRYAFKDWDMKDKLVLVNAIALEKLAMGIPILKAPADANTTDRTSAREALRQMRMNEEAFMDLPDKWEIEMMDMKANSTKDVIPTIQYHDRQILLSVLGQFLALGASDASGSRAVSSDHSKMFLLSEEAVNKNLMTVIQEQLINQLCDLNFSELPNGYPKLTSSKLGDEDIVALADGVNKLMTAGALTADPDMEDHLRKSMHLPLLPDDMKENYLDLKAKTTPVVDKKIEDQQTKDDLAKEKKTVKASAIDNAKKARQGLIDVILAD